MKFILNAFQICRNHFEKLSKFVDQFKTHHMNLLKSASNHEFNLINPKYYDQLLKNLINIFFLFFFLQNVPKRLKFCFTQSTSHKNSKRNYKSHKAHKLKRGF